VRGSSSPMSASPTYTELTPTVSWNQASTAGLENRRDVR
jgi:hypothetical protein